jgi:hypothetical protein
MRPVQQTTLLDRTIVSAIAAAVRPQTDYTLKLALVYQDSLARLWSEHVRDMIATIVGKEALRCSEWKIGNLVEAGVFSQGIAALARADAMVFAMREAEPLPAEFYLWANLWLQQRAGRPGALIALIDTDAENRAGSRDIRSFLQALARQGRLELFLKECQRPSAPAGVLGEDQGEWAKAA